MTGYLSGWKDASAFVERSIRNDRVASKKYKHGQGKCPAGEYLVVPKDGRQPFCRAEKKNNAGKVAMGVGIPLAALAIGTGIAAATAKRKGKGISNSSSDPEMYQSGDELARTGEGSIQANQQNKSRNNARGTKSLKGQGELTKTQEKQQQKAENRKKEESNKSNSSENQSSNWNTSRRARVSDDDYSALGLDKNASDKEIKKKFRELAIKYHPDYNAGDKNVEERFKRINVAFERISNSRGGGSKRMGRGDSLSYYKGFFDLNLLFDF